MRLNRFSKVSVRIAPRSIFFASLIFWNIWFPKAGVYFGSVPITVGYVFLGASAVVCLPALFSRLTHYQVIGLVLTAAFFGWYLAVNLVDGYEDTGAFVSGLASFGLLPIFFVGIVPNLLTPRSYAATRKAVCYGVLFAAIFGVVNFVYFLRAGVNLTIPGLTSGFGAADLVKDRNNLRAVGVEKLISTYQNGNLYGVCTLQLLPFFLLLEDRFLRRLVVIVALVLTLSRSVWIGLIVLLLCSSVGSVLQHDLKRATTKLLGIGVALLVLLAAVVWITQGLLDRSVLAFIADPQLGGRLVELQVPAQLLPLHVVHAEWEIVWSSVLDNYGVFGVLLFGAALFWPLSIVDFYRRRETRALLAGVFIYAVMCCEDGGIELIPTMFVFWLLVGLLLFNVRCRANWRLVDDIRPTNYGHDADLRTAK